MTEASLKIEGDYVVSDGEDGHPIGICDLDDDIAALIAATAADIGYGTISFSRPKNNIDRYILKSKVVLNPGIALDFRGSTLDLTGLNDIAFEWGEDAVWSFNTANSTGIKNVRALGAAANPNTWLAKANNIDRGVLFDDCKLRTCANGIEVRGASYDATLRNIYSEYPTGEFIRISSIDAEGYSPNGALIDHAESIGNNNAIGINILAAPHYTPEIVMIRDCWLERQRIGIYNEGKDTNVRGGMFSSEVGYAIHCKRGAYPGSGDGANISGGTILSAHGPTGDAVYLEGPSTPNIELNGVTLNYGGIGTDAFANAIVMGCKFYYTPAAIRGPWINSTFNTNRMHSSTASHVFARLKGAYYNTFSGNNIKQGIVFVDGLPTDNTFTGNYIAGNSSTTLGQRCTFSNNEFTGALSLIMGHSSIVMGNRVQGLATVSIGGNSVRQGNLMTGG